MKAHDDYPTCAHTHASFRIMQKDLEPAAITKLLGARPSAAYRRGALVSPKRAGALKAERGGWWITSKGRVKSFDARRHIDWVLDRLEGKGPVLRRLQKKGYIVDLCCQWDSRLGLGGPTLSPPQIKKLAKLGIGLWFDIYFACKEASETGKTRCAKKSKLPRVPLGP